jgi:hypothetical protein
LRRHFPGLKEHLAARSPFIEIVVDHGLPEFIEVVSETRRPKLILNDGPSKDSRLYNSLMMSVPRIFDRLRAIKDRAMSRMSPLLSSFLWTAESASLAIL